MLAQETLAPQAVYVDSHVDPGVPADQVWNVKKHPSGAAHVSQPGSLELLSNWPRQCVGKRCRCS